MNLLKNVVREKKTRTKGNMQIWPWIGLIPLLPLWFMYCFFSKNNYKSNARISHRGLICTYVLSGVFLLMLRSLDPFCNWLYPVNMCVFLEHCMGIVFMITCWTVCFSWCVITNAYRPKTTEHAVTSAQQRIFQSVLCASFLSMLCVLLVFSTVPSFLHYQIINGLQATWTMLMLCFIVWWSMDVIYTLDTHIHNMSSLSSVTSEQPHTTTLRVARQRIRGMLALIVVMGIVAVVYRVSRATKCLTWVCTQQPYTFTYTRADAILLHVQLGFILLLEYYLSFFLKRNLKVALFSTRTPTSPSLAPHTPPEPQEVHILPASETLELSVQSVDTVPVTNNDQVFIT